MVDPAGAVFSRTWVWYELWVATMHAQRTKYEAVQDRLHVVAYDPDWDAVRACGFCVSAFLLIVCSSRTCWVCWVCAGCVECVLFVVCVRLCVWSFSSNVRQHLLLAGLGMKGSSGEIGGGSRCASQLPCTTQATATHVRLASTSTSTMVHSRHSASHIDRHPA